MAVPNAAKANLLRGEHNLETDDVRVLLLDDSESFAFDPDTHEFVEDVLEDGSEMDGDGYERKDVDSQAVAQDDSGDRGSFSGANVTWENIDAGTIQTVVVFIEESDDADSPVIAVRDDADVGDLPLPTNGSDVTINWDTDGILLLV